MELRKSLERCRRVFSMGSMLCTLKPYFELLKGAGSVRDLVLLGFAHLCISAMGQS